MDVAGDVIENHDVNRLAMLHTTSPPPTTTTTSAVPPAPTSAEHCKSCGGSTKRRSPFTASAERRFHKKIILQQPSSETHLHVLAIHVSNFTAAVPNLPIIPSAAVNPPPLDTPKSKIIVVPKTINPNSAKSKMNGLFPPPPVPLDRCRTAPSSTFDAAFKGKGLVTSKKLTSDQRLKRMKDSMREMSQWCSEVIREGEEEHGASEENINETSEKLAKSLTVSKIHRASTAPSSTFDALLMNKDLDTADEKLYSAKKLKGMKDRVNEVRQWCGQIIHEDEEVIGLEESKEDTPKKLKEMKDRVKEIHQWCGQVIHEEPSGSEENKEDTSKYGSNTVAVEVPTAWIDKAGDCFIAHFQCTCGKVYQLLFSDKYIYNMLIPIQQDGPDTESEEEVTIERKKRWLIITTKCPCKKGYRVFLSGLVCFYEII